MDTIGQCNIKLQISDDYGYNPSTMRCQLPEGHSGPHQEEFTINDYYVKVTWEPK